MSASDPQSAPADARRPLLTPWLLTLALGFGSTWIYHGIERSQREELDTVVRVTGEQLRHQFEIWFADRRRALQELAKRRPTFTTEEAYRAEAKSFLEWFPGFQAMSWLDEGGVARYVVPLEGNEAVVGLDLMKHPSPEVPRAIRKARSTGEVTRTPVIELAQGGRGFATYTPVRGIDGRPLGFINGVFRISHACSECLQGRDFARDFRFRLVEDGEVVGKLGNAAPGVPVHRFETWFFDRPVQLELAASPVLLASYVHGTGKLVLAFGWTASALAGLALWLQLGRRRQRAQEREQRRWLEAQLQEAHRLESVGRLAGGVAHDFNNYLTAILGCADLMGRDLPPGAPARSHVDLIAQAGQKAARLTDQLLTFARQRPDHPVLVDPRDLIREARGMLEKLLGDACEVRCELDEPTSNVFLDPVLFDSVLVNLTLNARDAMPRGGVVTIRARELERATGTGQRERLVCVEVEDEGEGIPEQERSRVFDPFYTTKSFGRGTGLGLATCFGIVSKAGGSIELDSELGRGTIVRVLLPAREGDATFVESSVPAALPSPEQSEGTILLAEDDPMVRAVAETVLLDAGFRVLTAADGRAALELARERGDELDLLLTDVIMPELEGLELADHLRELHPELPVVFLSGYSREAVPVEEWFLAKPFEGHELLRKVRAALTAARHPSANA